MSPPEYILDQRFEVLMMAAYDVARWDAPKILLPHEIPAFLEQYPASETIACSHNALFDMSILSWRYGWVPGLLQCTLSMVRALRNYQRNSLEAVIKELFGRTLDKSLIKSVRGMHRADIMRAGLWPAFCTYSMVDARECWHIYSKLYPEFPPEERAIMDLVLRAAVVPRIHADVPMLEQHLEDLRKRKQYLLRASGYDKAALMSVQSFKEALESLGVEVKTKISGTGREIPAFAKTDQFMADLLEHPDFQVQALAAARLSEKSTIEETRAQRFLNIAKLPWGNAALLPIPLRYGAAHTHRLGGEWKMNPQNLPRDKEKSKLRQSLTVPPGTKLMTADLAQIEARITAKIAGQDDLVEAFRHGVDVYAQFASYVFGILVNKKDQPHHRFIGKTAVLGLGYGCGWSRFFNMVVTDARKYGIPLEGLFDQTLARNTVHKYRSMYAGIPRSWEQLDYWWQAVLDNPQIDKPTKWPDEDTGPLEFRHGHIVLPNKMTLRYTSGQKLWGGVLLENIVQALARIVVMQAAVRLSRRGYRFVLQAHDELVFAVPEDDVNSARNIISQEMTRTPKWLPGLPLAVEIGVGDNYGECK